MTRFHTIIPPRSKLSERLTSEARLLEDMARVAAVAPHDHVAAFKAANDARIERAKRARVGQWA